MNFRTKFVEMRGVKQSKASLTAGRRGDACLCSKGVCAAAQTSQAAALPLAHPTKHCLPLTQPWLLDEKPLPGHQLNVATLPRALDLPSLHGTASGWVDIAACSEQDGDVCTVPQGLLVTPLLGSSLDNRLNFTCSLHMYKIHQEGTIANSFFSRTTAWPHKPGDLSLGDKAPGVRAPQTSTPSWPLLTTP